MNTKGRSTLAGQIGKLIGFGFAEHPIIGDSFIEIIFYKTKTDYVICISEGPLSGILLTNLTDSQRHGLGQDVPGEGFAPFAVRSIDTKLPYEDLKKLMNETMPASIPGIKLEWYK